MVIGMTQTANAATELAREHDEIDRLATRIATLAPGPERSALVHEICARFLIHVQAEERYLHPVVRRLLRDGPFLAAFQTRRNRAVARTIECAERGQAEGDEFDILVGHLLIGIQDHVERQDTILLPALVDACPIEEINQLGEMLHEGIRAAREAAERAGARECEQHREQQQGNARNDGAGSPGGGQQDADAAAEVAEPHAGEQHCGGFKALLRRIARGSTE